MKLLFTLLFFGISVLLTATEDDPNVILAEMTQEISVVKRAYAFKKEIRISQKKEILKKLSETIDYNTKTDLLLEKLRLEDEEEEDDDDEEKEISKIRYIKGIQIIRILYDKVLSLDHHFASVHTFSEINKISNPNHYPEFSKVKDLINEKRDKKFNLDLSAILGNNLFATVINTFTNLAGSSFNSEQKKQELQKIECIVDFTLRMHTDLNIIYFETAYLQSNNISMKADIETLFKEYTKPVNYLGSLADCRNNDDWESVNQKLEEYLTKIQDAKETEKYKLIVNLEFPIDRLLQFINQYNNFISEGEKFYEKFKIILNSYENEKQCETQIPIEYKKLKEDIDIAINKFKIAYKPVEVNGTKMKEILYGISEY